jgi:AcrR family transcriptional regulator
MFNNPARKPGRPSSEAEVDGATVLEEAFSVFAEQGYEKATVRALATACGVSPALLTHRFQSKENLWYEAVDAVYGPIHDRQMAEIRALESESVDFQRFRETLTRSLLDLMDVDGLLPFLVREAVKDTPRGRYLRRHYLRERLDAMWRLYEGSCRRSEIKPAPRATFDILLMGLVRVFAEPGDLQDSHPGLLDSDGRAALAEDALERLFRALT